MHRQLLLSSEDIGGTEIEGRLRVSAFINQVCDKLYPKSSLIKPTVNQRGRAQPRPRYRQRDQHHCRHQQRRLVCALRRGSRRHEGLLAGAVDAVCEALRGAVIAAHIGGAASRATGSVIRFSRNCQREDSRQLPRPWMRDICVIISSRRALRSLYIGRAATNFKKLSTPQKRLGVNSGH
jgi:hypothetical protein